ncbi:MAG: carbohydrate kinase, partial [Cellulosimicrobium sp.]|nr:carbohydrate kinase [Cellulosimicrobium sp.]
MPAIPFTEAAPAEATADDRHVLVVGEALIDVVHRADGSVDEHPGGSLANVALTLGRLGRDARLATWLGTDAHGDA